MVETDMNHRHAIVALVPTYAHTRRAGWTPATVLPGQVALPEYLLLRRVAIERADEPVPLHDLQAHALNPYSTVDRFLDGLPRLVRRGFLDYTADTYTVTSEGRDLLTRGERAANDYAADRITLAPDDLERLSATLADITTRQHRAPEPTVKEHQDRVPHLRRFDPRQTPPVQLEYAIYALQRARDDAHIAAWRDAGLTGPMIELLSRVWTGTAATVDHLAEQTRGRMLAADVAETVEKLEQAGYIAVDSATIAITRTGRNVRDAIECETDRVYFTTWPEIDAEWIHDRLTTITTQLSR